MKTMNISLPDALRSFVSDQVSTRGYSSPSEYVCKLIRKDYDRQRMRDRLFAGAKSPKGAVADADYFDRLRDGVRKTGHQ